MKQQYCLNGLLIALAIALAICIWFLLQPDKQHDTHKDDKADVIADHDTLKAHGVDYARANDSLAKENARLKDANKSLVKGQAATRKQLDNKTEEVRILLMNINEAYDGEGPLGHMLDSLQQQYDNLRFLIVQHEQYADSINNVNDSLKIGYETVKKADDKRIAELQVSYDKLFKAYMDLFKTTADLQKDLKRQKLQKKIAALIGLGGLIKGFVK